MKTRDIKYNLEIQIDINPDNLISFELNIVDNISVDVGTNSITNIYNIGVGIDSSSNNSLEGMILMNIFKKIRKMKTMRLILIYMTHQQIIICFRFINF